MFAYGVKRRSSKPRNHRQERQTEKDTANALADRDCGIRFRRSGQLLQLRQKTDKDSVDDPAEYPNMTCLKMPCSFAEETKVSRSGTSSVQPIYIRPAENTRKMLDEMDKARHADYGVCLWPCPFGGLGPPTARTIANTFGSLDAFEQASVDELSQIDGIGPEIAESVVTWFASAKNPGDWRGMVLEAWKAAGVGVGQAQTSALPQTLEGKTVVVTGSLVDFSAGFRQRGDYLPRWKGRRIGQQENRLGGRRRKRWCQSRQSRGIGNRHAGRGPVQTAAGKRNGVTRAIQAWQRNHKKALACRASRR